MAVPKKKKAKAWKTHKLVINYNKYKLITFFIDKKIHNYKPSLYDIFIQ